jgi:hypothetical protein
VGDVIGHRSWKGAAISGRRTKRLLLLVLAALALLAPAVRAASAFAPQPTGYQLLSFGTNDSSQRQAGLIPLTLPSGITATAIAEGTSSYFAESRRVTAPGENFTLHARHVFRLCSGHKLPTALTLHLA